MDSKVLGEDNLSKEGQYWINTLSDSPFTRYLPCSLVSDQNSNELSRSSIEFNIDNLIAEKIIEFSRNSELKIFSILTACLQAFLYLYDYKNDFKSILWTPVLKESYNSNSSLNTKKIIGIENKITTEMNFNDLLFQVDEVIEAANKNSNYPIDSILRDLGYDFKNNECEMFDIGLIYNKIHDENESQVLYCNIVFKFSRNQDSIFCTVDYKNAHYKKEDIEAFISYFCNILSFSVENINSKVVEIPMLSNAEIYKLLEEFNNTVADYPEKESLITQFYKQVEKAPNSEAVIFKDVTLSYKELNEKSNQVARKLKKEGIKKNSVVAIMLGRSEYIVIGILAIMKVGGTYLPIDPVIPNLRIQYMLTDSKTNLILSEKMWLNKVPENYKVLDIKNENIYLEDSSNLEENISFDDLMNIIYTSGSTGNPKGVLVPYRGMVNIINWYVNELKFTSKDISLQLVNYTFDGFAVNLFPVLTVGGKSIILDEEDSKNFISIRDFIHKYQVTNMGIVPSVYRAILEVCKPGDLSSLRFVQVAGDKTDIKLVNLSHRINPYILLVNAYGPTENSIQTTTYLGMKPNKKVLIGKPIYNNKVFVLGKHNVLMPIGAPGELCVSGYGLAKGYLNDIKLTNEKFIPNPYIKGEIMYRTGDLVKWSSDGNLDFLGRIDNQVKVRGLRIETQEIENCLLKLDYVKEAVVVVKSKEFDNMENTYLCAYIVLEKGINDNSITASDYRRHLSKYLPFYMIPSYFILIDKKPLTRNGKLDINALPEINKCIKTGNKYTAPTTYLEKKLVKMWANLLRIDTNKIGIHDNLFELGGNSLIMIQLAQNINSEFSVELPLKLFFEEPTIGWVAQYIGENADIVGL
ncbi:amino acid adenylation domain-containing protein [Paenibacillus sophorae]|uniref:Amino acid adenylation domain-containing protein n=1 Tax=Paenibacillus sophorae TaxID=1333845 RepID=A0A1H8KHQ9_9BACL|nr:non-ribosomal peptide synthetase [Paenibacillus sophorae]QWU13743.1 amino acid adenylation domain-containing protein [Paenibacillus sophorae]SEN92231.1 amino acid adenylation domain-containing protein [Paenibacillus sophorae]